MDRRMSLGLLAAFLGIASPSALNAQGTAPAPPRYQVAFATYLAGPAWEQAREAIVCPDGSIIVALPGPSATLPTTEGVVQPAGAPQAHASGYLARLSPDGSKLVSATYLWGSLLGVARDAQGNLVVAGRMGSAVLPATPGCFQEQFGGGQGDAYVAKLSPDMKRVIWATYLGGSDVENVGAGIALDAQDNVYVAGNTRSPNFPTTAGAVQSTRKGVGDVFVTALKADGSALLASTLLGGSADEGCMGVHVGPAGDIYVGGHTASADFPTTPGVFQAAPGGQSDCFLARLSPKADRLVYSTYLGGSQDDWAEHQLGLLPDGSVLLTGATSSPEFPATPGAAQRDRRGAGDGFAARLGADGKSLVWSTLLGGSDSDMHLWPTQDAAGNVFVVGSTQSRDYPTTPGAVQATFAGGKSDGTLTLISADGSKLLYSTLIGGSGEDIIRGIALGPNGEIVLVGGTMSPDFPVTPNALQAKPVAGQDAFIVKLVPAPRP